MKNPPKGSDGEMIANYIRDKGEGVHHIALAVGDIKGMLKRLAQKGVALVDKEPRPGAHGPIAFIDDKSTYGTTLELCQPEHK